MNLIKRLFVKLCLLTAKRYNKKNDFDNAEYWLNIARINIRN